MNKISRQKPRKPTATQTITQNLWVRLLENIYIMKEHWN